MKKSAGMTIRAIAAAGITLAVVGLPAVSQRRGGGQAPPGAEASQSTSGSYLIVGSPSDADLDRLLTAIRQVDGVEQAEVRKIPGNTLLRVRAAALGTIIIAAARKAGFELKQTPTRIYQATGPVQSADLAQLRTTLRSLPGVEQVEMALQPGGLALRVRGAISPAELAAALKPAGLTASPVSAFVASGPAAPADVAQLRAALNQLLGVSKIETRAVVGGANLIVYGDVKEEALTKTARASGYGLLTVNEPAGDTQRFTVQGVTNSEDETKLREALRSAGVTGQVQLQRNGQEVRLGVPSGGASGRALAGALREAGFDITPVDTVTLPSIGSEKERITPPAPNERIIDEKTRVGEAAPDFSLLMHDGRGKITLSNSFGKRPVVLIFGSYT